MRYNRCLSLLFFFACIPLIAVVEKPIVVIVPSYNNQQWYKHNLDSLFYQKYNNYRVIYINDCSSDSTGELVYAYIQQLGMSDRCMFIENSVRRGALANLYRAIHSCADDEIMVTLDGDDWFVNDQVLARINKAYQDENIWLTYGQFKTYPQDTVGFCREVPPSIIQGNLFREYEWITSHPRTFYAALFKQVQLKDLLYEGNFFDVTWDMAFMYPMLEMAADHFKFIPDVMYAYNQGNVLNDFRQKVVRQIHCKYYVSSKEKYTRIVSLPNKKDTLIDLMVFSENTPDRLDACLKSLQCHLNGIDTITVLYRDGEQTRNAYQNLKNTYNYLTFCDVNDGFLKNKLLNVLSGDVDSYVLFVDDTVELQESCDVQVCASALSQTKAHAFYMALGKDCEQQLPSMVNIWDDICAWQFKYGSFAFKHPYDTRMVLYKKEIIKDRIENMGCVTATQMIQMLNDSQFDYEHIGLCFEHSKIKRK